MESGFTLEQDYPDMKTEQMVSVSWARKKQYNFLRSYIIMRVSNFWSSNFTVWYGHYTWLSSIWKSGFRILQSNAKSENRFHLRGIRPQGGFQLRNPNPDFMDFLFTVRLGNPKKDLQNCSREQRSFFANYARACKTAVFKDSQFQSLFGFPNRTVERKSKKRFLSVEIRFWISRSIANPKSGF